MVVVDVLRKSTTNLDIGREDGCLYNTSNLPIPI